MSVGSSDGVLDLDWLAVRIVDRAQHAEDRDASWKPEEPGLIICWKNADGRRSPLSQGKLVRDKIPQIIRSKGKEPIVYVAERRGVCSEAA